MRRHLVGPLHFAVVRVAGEDGHRPLVVARTLVGVPRAGVTRAVVEQVQLGIVRIPAPGGAAAPLPLVALPGRDAEVLALVRRIVGVGVAFEEDFAVRTGAVSAPDLFPVVHVIRRHAAPDAELTARDTGDDDVLDHDRGVGHRGALLVIRVLDLPELFAGLGIEREKLTLEQLDEDLAARVIRGAAVHQVATGDWNRVRRLVRHVLPDHRRAGLGQIERVHDVREGRVDVHHVADDERIALVPPKRPGRERPDGPELGHVRRRDLLERAEPLQAVITTGHVPFALGRIQGPSP